MTTLQLFFACVAIWGSTWLAITYQLGHVAPEASVLYRFLLASLLLFGYCRLRGLPLGYRLREHAWIALQGALMFSVGYVLVYHAELHVVSGLVAVGYSASPLLNMLAMRAFFGAPMTRPMAIGSILGLAGIVLVFWPELARVRAGADAALGTVFTVASVLVNTLANMVAHRNQRAGHRVWQTMAWGMLYGAACTLAWLLLARIPLTFEPTATYVGSLLYLAILGSVVTFAAYLTLLARIGAARVGYVGVMVPIVALAVSAAVEGFRWEVLTWAGVAVSIAGNVIVLRR